MVFGSFGRIRIGGLTRFAGPSFAPLPPSPVSADVNRTAHPICSYRRTTSSTAARDAFRSGHDLQGSAVLEQPQRTETPRSLAHRHKAAKLVPRRGRRHELVRSSAETISGAAFRRARHSFKLRSALDHDEDLGAALDTCSRLWVLCAHHRTGARIRINLKIEVDVFGDQAAFRQRLTVECGNPPPGPQIHEHMADVGPDLNQCAQRLLPRPRGISTVVHAAARVCVTCDALSGQGASGTFSLQVTGCHAAIPEPPHGVVRSLTECGYLSAYRGHPHFGSAVSAVISDSRTSTERTNSLP
jgi:hypothetical protein